MLMFLASICFQKSRKLKDLRNFFRFFWQKKGNLAKKKFLTILKPFCGFLFSKKADNLPMIVVKSKSWRKASTSSKTIFFAKKLLHNLSTRLVCRLALLLLSFLLYPIFTQYLFSFTFDHSNLFQTPTQHRKTLFWLKILKKISGKNFGQH